MPDQVRIPLADWADAELAELAWATRSARISALSGPALLGERAALNGFVVPGQTSVGGGCRMYGVLDGTIALNLARPGDRELLPALVGADDFDVADVAAVATRIAAQPVAALLDRGRTLGLAIASIDEVPASPAVEITTTGSPHHRTNRPLVLDLSALWAGPLAAHLLWLSGADVIKVESRNRPDSLRDGDPALFALLNQGKANVALDLRAGADRAALLTLIRRADVVIEAARPRALLQLGIDAAALVREVPGLVWLTITGHGVNGAAANWIGFGDDTAIAGGLSRELRDATATLGFVGDAVGDPLSGIYAAKIAAAVLAGGQGGRHVIAMSGVVAQALASARATNPDQLTHDLQLWAKSVGQPFPAVTARQTGPVTPLGADTARLFS